MDYNVIPIPDGAWLMRLRQGHVVYDPKSGGFWAVEFAWEPPGPGRVSGQIGLRQLNQHHDGWHVARSCDTWYVYANGFGFDGESILLPVEGHCPEEEPPISSVWQRRVERHMAQTMARMDQLQADMNTFTIMINELEEL